MEEEVNGILVNGQNIESWLWHTSYNLTIQEAEATPGLHRKFQDSHSYIETLSQKDNKNKSLYRYLKLQIDRLIN